MTKGILVAGSGGQGILFTGKLIAQAAMEGAMNVTWFPSYGAEVRGGTANCTVVISDGLIGSPVVSSPDVLAVMNEASLERFSGKVRKNGLIILNSSMVSGRPEKKRNGLKVVEVPAGEIAFSIGAPLSANMVISGALARAASICDLPVLKHALKMLFKRAKPAILEINLKALERGWQHVD
ncbi:MAG: 2-oxoacid:acceptor oxidoreductase family protein [Nitrospiraceae bacterium]|nr:2-oxoacid:acceptor oxidoreductase family protein [Nitrospiraceae bacterium]